MSVSYDLKLVYGVSIPFTDHLRISTLVKDFGEDKSQEDNPLYADMEGNFYEKFPLVRCTFNYDQVSGELLKSLVVYTKSSSHNLNLHGYNSGDYQQYPLNLNRLKTNADEVEQLKDFMRAYGVSNVPGWIIAAMIL